MAPTKFSIVALSWAISAIFIAISIKPYLDRLLLVTGTGRKITPTVVSHSDDFRYIDDTIHCEDLHYYEPAGVIFTACQDENESRLKWFPPLANFDDPVAAMNIRGSLHVINPETLTSSRLELQNFYSPFISHGIDVIADPNDRSSVYIFAVNHIPHPDYIASLSTGHPVPPPAKSRSVIEVFHYHLGSSSARHLRTIYHPAIHTPNDLFARSVTSLFVTNDHHYREGHMRLLEEIHPGATWTETIHVAISDLEPPSQAAHDAIRVSKALSPVHHNNGLAHGRNPDEILIADCLGGKTLIGSISGSEISITDSVVSSAVVDNPSFFSDPYGDKSGIVMPGLAKVSELSPQMRIQNHRMSGLVNFAIPRANTSGYGARDGKGWEMKTLFEDDGERLSSVSAAVLVHVRPGDARGQEREAWLFASGFMSQSVVAVRVIL